MVHAKTVLLVKLQMMTASPALKKYHVLMIAQALIKEIVIKEQDYAFVKMDILVSTVQVQL